MTTEKQSTPKVINVSGDFQEFLSSTWESVVRPDTYFVESSGPDWDIRIVEHRGRKK